MELNNLTVTEGSEGITWNKLFFHLIFSVSKTETQTSQLYKFSLYINFLWLIFKKNFLGLSWEVK